MPVYGNIKNAYVAEEDHHECIGLEVAHRRRVVYPPPLVRVLQPDRRQHQARLQKAPDHPERVEREV